MVPAPPASEDCRLTRPSLMSLCRRDRTNPRRGDALRHGGPADGVVGDEGKEARRTWALGRSEVDCVLDEGLGRIRVALRTMARGESRGELWRAAGRRVGWVCRSKDCRGISTVGKGEGGKYGDASGTDRGEGLPLNWAMRCWVHSKTPWPYDRHRVSFLPPSSTLARNAPASPPR